MNLRRNQFVRGIYNTVNFCLMAYETMQKFNFLSLGSENDETQDLIN